MCMLVLWGFVNKSTVMWCLEFDLTLLLEIYMYVVAFGINRQVEMTDCTILFITSVSLM